MTLFNHFKYHFTQGIPIPSRATVKTKAHQVRPLEEHLLACSRERHEHGIAAFQRKRARLFWCETAKWEKMKESEFITVKLHWIWLLLSTQRKYPSFDSWCALACITHPLSHDFDMTKWSLTMEQIKDSIFCLSDISMSKLFAGKLCFSVLDGWPPTGITICPRWGLLQRNSFYKSWYLILGIVSYSILYLHTCTKWIPNQALPQTLVLHVLLAIALLLTFNPHWGQQPWGWRTRWCSTFSPGGISCNIHSLIYTAAGWKNLHWSFLNQRGHKRGSCVEEPGSCWQLLSVRLHQ